MEVTSGAGCAGLSACSYCVAQKPDCFPKGVYPSWAGNTRELSWPTTFQTHIPQETLLLGAAWPGVVRPSQRSARGSAHTANALESVPSHPLAGHLRVRDPLPRPLKRLMRGLGLLRG